MADKHPQGTGWIWKVFWILLVITTFEVVLGIWQPKPLEVPFLGTRLLNTIFIILTLVKAFYIVSAFMHLGHERKSLKWMIYLPPLILIPYLVFIVLAEGSYLFGNY